MDQEKRGLGCSQEVESLPGPGSETEVGGGRVALLPTRSISTRPVGIGSRELPGLQTPICAKLWPPTLLSLQDTAPSEGL